LAWTPLGLDERHRRTTVAMRWRRRIIPSLLCIRRARAASANPLGAPRCRAIGSAYDSLLDLAPEPARRPRHHSRGSRGRACGSGPARGPACPPAGQLGPGVRRLAGGRGAVVRRGRDDRHPDHHGRLSRRPARQPCPQRIRRSGRRPAGHRAARARVSRPATGRSPPTRARPAPRRRRRRRRPSRARRARRPGRAPTARRDRGTRSRRTWRHSSTCPNATTGKPRPAPTRRRTRAWARPRRPAEHRLAGQMPAGRTPAMHRPRPCQSPEARRPSG
jgi:hypothetical protein